MKRVSIVIVLIVWLVQFSNAATYYVDINGNDATGDGSTGKPWRTIKFALSKVSANQGHVIRVSAGTFIEQGPLSVPPQVNIEGAGNTTIIKAASSFYYVMTGTWKFDRILIQLKSSTSTDGNQYLKNFVVDGDNRNLFGGIIVQGRNRVLIDGVTVQYANFSGIYLWSVKDSRITNTKVRDCAWYNSSYATGAINLANVERIEIDHNDVFENYGVAVKAMGAPGEPVYYCKFHDNKLVAPLGTWANPQGGISPSIVFELYDVDLKGNEIFNNNFKGNVSLVAWNRPQYVYPKNTPTVRVYNNVIDCSEFSYGLELSIHDVEIDHNYFYGGQWGISNWQHFTELSATFQNWKIHHNIFYDIKGSTPGILRTQSHGIRNVEFYNNTIELTGQKEISVVQLLGGASSDVKIRNNVIINNTTGPYTYYPPKFIQVNSPATVAGLVVTNNFLQNLPLGNVPGTYANNLSGDPQINKTGNRPDPYYRPKSGSPLIDKGVNVGFPFSGTAPDIGAYEYGSTTTPPANTPPSIGLSSPANNASFSAGGSITLTANAADPDGSITRVEFFNGTTKLGEDTSSPYSFTWASVPAGTYSITARATDNAGATTTSTPITITVVAAVNAAPTVSITSPANNTNVNAGSSITINANATDSNGSVSKVEFFNGTTKLGEDTSSPYSFTWSNVVAGTYSITARATDNQGAITNSAAITVVVNVGNALPAVSLTSPANNASYTAPASFTITATATDTDGTIAKVEFFSGASKLGEDTSSPYSYNWANLTAGTYSITAKATDNSGGVTTSSVRTVSVQANALPTVAITSPANNAAFTEGSTVALAATASDSDGTITKVEFYNGSTKLGEDTSSPYSFSWPNVGPGTYSVTARATDNLNGIRNSTAITITVTANPNVLPTVSLTSPANNSEHITGSNITLAATATDSDGTIAKVEFFNGSTKLGEDTSSPYSFVWNSVRPGNYTLTARATDNESGVKTSTAVSIRVGNANALPTVKMTKPSSKTTFSTGSSVAMEAEATDSDGTIAKVDFFSGTTKLGTDTSAPYTLTWGNVPTGSYDLKAVATDNAGAVATSTSVLISVNTVTNNLPTVALTSPSNNAGFSSGSTITLNASAADSDGSITKVEFYNGATKLGEDLSSPYSYAWNNVSAGSYTLTAKATDDKNGVSTSAAIRINVADNNAPPTVSITSPANNSDHSAGSQIAITATATDSDGTISKVEFFNGSTKLGEDASSPYTFNWPNAPIGNHTIVAKATDNDGATSTAQISIFVDIQNAAPVANAGNDATIELPETTYVLNGSGEDTDGVILEYTWTQVEGPNDALIVEGSTLGEAVASGLVEGVYKFVLTVTDNASLTGSDEVIITVAPLGLSGIQLPLVFTPNNDGIDDTWNWSNTEAFEDCKLTIYNRFGQKIYETVSYNNTWDGRVNGSPLQEDAYYYVITCENEDKKGAVRIVR